MKVPTAEQQETGISEWFVRLISQCYMLAFLNGKEKFGVTPCKNGHVHWFIARRGEVIMAMVNNEDVTVWATIVEAKPSVVMESYYSIVKEN